jgi:large repetitive protein
MYRKLVFVLTMFAVAFGSLGGAQAALASQSLPARVASAAHAWTTASTATHHATGTVRAATATRQMAHRARLRTEQRQGSLSLSGDRRATETASAPKITSAVIAAPAITSADSATFTVGQVGSFTVTTTGTIPMLLSESGALPSGVTFKGNRNGTATLSGTPGAGTTGPYTFTITAANLVPPFTATQSFTLTVNQACQITSSAGTTFTVGHAGTFTVTSTGVPNCALSETGSLPSWLTFTDNGGGTATLAGTPPTGSGGTYPFTITATNVATPPATQSFTLTVHPITCTITSSAVDTFTVGQAGTFTVTTSGVPPCVLSEKGALPSGVTFTDNGNGTATLTGTPAAGSGGPYPFTITATNIAGYNTQSFILTVDQACQITAAPLAPTLTAAFPWPSTVPSAVTSTGWPTCKLSATSLPPTINFKDNGDGTGTFSGTPTAPGTSSVTITAHNGVGPDATQTFTLTVVPGQACAIGSAHHATFTVGQAGTFTVTSTGVPNCALSETGALPPGVTFIDNGDGTATLAGTPGAGSGGAYPFTITATNGVSPPATEPFILSVLQAPGITSSAGTTFTVGQAGTFTVTTTGVPNSTLSDGGVTLPSGVTFTDNGDGTATLSGTPAANTGGTYPFTITATNGVSPDATQTFTLTVNQAPGITSSAGTTFTVGQAGTFTVTTTGWPNSTLSEPRNLPKGVRFTGHRDGTATLAGTPARGTGGVYLLRIIATNGVKPGASQTFTLIVLQRPQITSADHTTCTVGKPCAFTVTSTGVPIPNLSETGKLPSRVRFRDNGNGTAALSGTPAANTGGTYKFTIIARNGASPDIQHFTLTVVRPRR